jgi:hypothetical protein
MFLLQGVKIVIAVCFIMTPCNLYVVINVSEELAASIFYTVLQPIIPLSRSISFVAES